MDIANVPYTYIGANSTSKLDNFLISQNLADCVLDCSIINNHLHSDHVPVTVTFDIDVVHNTELERTYVTRVAWHKASNDYIDKYKTRLDMLLSNIQYKCNDKLCSVHKVNICNLYSDVISACNNAAECIPTTAPPRTKCLPGWKEHVDKLMKESLYCHRCWKDQCSPHLGDIAQIQRITRARYHHAIKIVKREEDKIQMERMAEAIASNNYPNLFFDVNKIKGMVICCLHV